MNNKSRKREFRVMYDSADSYPYYIQYRYLGWLKVFGWHAVNTDHSDVGFYIQTYPTKHAAIDHIERLIRSDDYVTPNRTIEQVWPEEQQ